MGVEKQKSGKVKAFILSIIGPLSVFFVAQVVAAIALGIFIPGFFEEGATTSIAANFAYVLTFELGVLAIVWWYMKRKKITLEWLGLGDWPKLKDMLRIIPVAGVYLVLTVVSFMVVEMLNTGVDLNQDQTVGFEGASSSLEILLAFLALVILTPLTEEVLMRGIMFRNLRRTFNFVVAAGVSAAVFGVMHGQANLFIDTFVLGLALAWLVEKTDSLWPAIGLHMLKNTIAFLYLFVL